MESPETNTNTLEDFIDYLVNQLVQEESKLERLGIQYTKQQNKVDDMNKNLELLQNLQKDQNKKIIKIYHIIYVKILSI